MLRTFLLLGAGLAASSGADRLLAKGSAADGPLPYAGSGDDRPAPLQPAGVGLYTWHGEARAILDSNPTPCDDCKHEHHTLQNDIIAYIRKHWIKGTSLPVNNQGPGSGRRSDSTVNDYLRASCCAYSSCCCC